MRLTKRDMALLKLAYLQFNLSILEERYQYSDYLKIIKQANKNENRQLDS